MRGILGDQNLQKASFQVDESTHVHPTGLLHIYGFFDNSKKSLFFENKILSFFQFSKFQKYEIAVQEIHLIQIFY